ncbi:hypothetical protein ACP70R_007505 [Stipagrostis hirtigluma subsp. patula]
MAEWIASSSSSSPAPPATARGVRILDAVEEERRKMASLLLDTEEAEGEETAQAVAMSRGCDVYVGHGGEARRVAAWLRAELEMLGVPCVAADRRRCGDAPAHGAARAAMDAAAVGVVLVTPASLANPYAVEEVRCFVRRGALVAVLVGVRRADLAAAEDVVARRGDVWGRHGGQLWMAYDGDEAEWREAVEGLARADPAVEIGAGGLREGVLDALEVVGARLGRRAVATAVKGWRDAAPLDLPFPRNPGFLGRENELLAVEAALLGGARARDNHAAGKKPAQLADDLAAGEGPFVDGAVCITGVSGSGKTELALEFAHRHAQEYKQVLWVQGEGRYLRQGYLRLADRLGVAVGDDVTQATPRSLHDIEGDAIARIRKELARDIPYLLVLDNVESARDWWDGRDVAQELLPRAGGKRTHVVVTTRLAGLRGVRTLKLESLSASETMKLMKGTRAFGVEDMAVLRGIEEKVGHVALAVALVGAILSELAVGPAELRDAMGAAPRREATWASSKGDAVLRDNPGLVQLLDACFALLDKEAAGLGATAARLVEAVSFFAPAPVAVATLARAAGACASAGERPLWKRLARTLHLSCTSPRGGHGEPEALAMLLRLGVARWCTQAGCVAVHGVFRLFCRKVGGAGHVAASVVRAIAAAHDQHAADRDHTWAACLSLFRFDAPAAAAELPAPELARFVKRSALPLAAHAVAAYSSYSAALELLREATDAVRHAEDRYVSAAGPRRGGGAGGGADVDPRVYQEIARARAEVLRTRAGMMLRAGEGGIAEDHCLAAISILEVVCGDAHPETQAVRAFLEHNVRARQAMD